MRFSLLFPLMLVLLGGATLLVGNVPAAEPQAAEPVELPPTRTVESQQAPPVDAPVHPPVQPPPVAPPVEPPIEPPVEPSLEPPDEGAPGEDVPGEDVPGEASEEPEPPAEQPSSAGAGPLLFFMPVDGVTVAEVPDSFGDPRGADRLHEGIDIMAERGTPVRAAAPGTVRRVTESARGGLSVTIIGDDGLRYFYTHFDSFPQGLEVGQEVGIDTVIGYVGNTGNAAATAPHLHFGVYRPTGDGPWSWEAFDPLPYLIDRAPATAP